MVYIIPEGVTAHGASLNGTVTGFVYGDRTREVARDSSPSKPRPVTATRGVTLSNNHGKTGGGGGGNPTLVARSTRDRDHPAGAVLIGGFSTHKVKRAIL